MSRIKSTFENLKNNNKTALIPYVTAGDPQPGFTVSFMHKMVEAGADLIELGVPFSDPMADGPVIQLACERALEHNVTLADVIDMVAEFRETNTETPVILMGYCNPIETMGYELFATKAKAAGVDGVLTVDLPPEESVEANKLFTDNDLDSIYLLSPTTQESRVERVCSMASGFVYYVSLKGVTGAANLDVQAVSDKIDQIKTHTSLPIGVGFGIKDAATARLVSDVADAVVIGSAIIKKIVENKDDKSKIESEIFTLLSTIRESIDL